jgi:hypothetical protein
MADFSSGYWASQVSSYCKGFDGKNGITEERWAELMEICTGKAEADNSELDTLEADLSILDSHRAFLFDFCSPTKS